MTATDEASVANFQRAAVIRDALRRRSVELMSAGDAPVDKGCELSSEARERIRRMLTRSSDS